MIIQFSKNPSGAGRLSGISFWEGWLLAAIPLPALHRSLAQKKIGQLQGQAITCHYWLYFHVRHCSLKIWGDQKNS
jgi:hypothetical protein